MFIKGTKIGVIYKVDLISMYNNRNAHVQNTCTYVISYVLQILRLEMFSISKKCDLITAFTCVGHGLKLNRVVS